MKKRNKLISLLLVASMAVGLLGGCGQGGEKQQGSKQSDNSSDSKAGDSVKLTVWNTTSATMDKGYQAIIDAYCEENPDVQIEFSSIGTDNYESKLSSALSSDMGPDVFYTYGWNNLETYVDAGFVENLDGKLNIESYPEDALKVETVDGSLYGAPGAFAAFYTVLYNKDLFAEAGIESTPTTYEEFTATCETLKKAGITPIAMGTAQTEPLLFTWVTTMKGMSTDFFGDISTGKKTTLVDDEFERCIQVLADWADAGYYSENYTGTNLEMQKVLFATGKAAMILASSSGVSVFKEQNPSLNLSGFTFPGEKGTIGVRSVESSLSLNAASANKEAALDFLNFTLTKEAQQMMVDATSGIPVTEDIAPKDEITKEIAEAPEYTSQPLIPLNIAGKNDSNPQEAFLNDIINVVNGDMTARELVEKMNEVWDSEKYVEQFK